MVGLILTMIVILFIGALIVFSYLVTYLVNLPGKLAASKRERELKKTEAELQKSKNDDVQETNLEILAALIEGGSCHFIQYRKNPFRNNDVFVVNSVMTHSKTNEIWVKGDAGTIDPNGKINFLRKDIEVSLDKLLYESSVPRELIELKVQLPGESK